MIEMSNLNSRNQQIDLLRGIGILLILIHHFHIAYHLDQSAMNNLISTEFINNGYYGITMLFVASGFLITTKAIERYSTLGKIDIIKSTATKRGNLIVKS